jgi:hypothetical protein
MALEIKKERGKRGCALPTESKTKPQGSEALRILFCLSMTNFQDS